MLEAASPLIHRILWYTSALLLAVGSLVLTFGVGWAAVEAASAIGQRAGEPTHGRDIAAAAGVAIAAGLVLFALLVRLEADERSIVRIDFDQPIVGFHGRPLTAGRWRVEARISLLVRGSFTAIVHNRAEDIAQAAAEALALLGPRAAHVPDRVRAEKALTEMVNRSLRSRVVRAIRIHRVDLAPAL